MPRVSTENLGTQRTKLEVHLSFDKKNEIFFSHLPINFGTVSQQLYPGTPENPYKASILYKTRWPEEKDPYVEIKAVSLTELRNRISNIVREYEKMAVTSTKVITYRLECNSPNMRKRTHSYFGSSGRWDEYSMSLRYKVEYRIQIGDQAYFSYKEYDPSTYGKKETTGRHWKWIEWTEEREKFFANAVESLEKMIEKCESILGDTDQLTGLIDSGTLLIGQGNG